MNTTNAAPVAEKTNREAFLAASRSIVADAVRNGTNISKIRALRNYMFERLDGVHKDEVDTVKATIIGEMFSTHEVAGKLIVSYAKEKFKFEGTECGPAMAAISVEQGIYTPTAEIWGNLAKALTADKKSQKDYVDLWRSLRAELRCIADKANQQMNNILEELGTKEKKKGGFGKKKAETVSEETPITPDKMVTEVCKLDAAQQIEALKLLVEAMLNCGISADDISDAVITKLEQFPEVPALAAA